MKESPADRKRKRGRRDETRTHRRRKRRGDVQGTPLARRAVGSGRRTGIRTYRSSRVRDDRITAARQRRIRTGLPPSLTPGHNSRHPQAPRRSAKRLHGYPIPPPSVKPPVSQSRRLVAWDVRSSRSHRLRRREGPRTAQADVERLERPPFELVDATNSDATAQGPPEPARPTVGRAAPASAPRRASERPSAQTNPQEAPPPLPPEGIRPPRGWARRL